MTILSLIVALALAAGQSGRGAGTTAQPAGAGNQTAARQLFAVRGQVVKIKQQGKGMLLITVRPAKEFPEVTVLARENDLVGSAVARADSDLFGLLTGDARDEETITAAEINEGDTVSVIYDPQSQNRALEIYFHY
jgi:hypothetical protein